MQLVVFFNGSMDLASAHLLAPKPKFLAMALPPQCWGAAPKAKYDIWHRYLANVVAALTHLDRRCYTCGKKQLQFPAARKLSNKTWIDI
jgi:hypothetical protein